MMDSLNIYEYDDVGTTATAFADLALTSPSLDEGSSPYGNGNFDSPFTPSPALHKKLSWLAVSSSPRPTASSTTRTTLPAAFAPAALLTEDVPATLTTEPTAFRGLFFASSPSPTRPAPASPEAHARLRREGTAAYHREPSLSPLAPEMASDTSSEATHDDAVSDTVVSFSTSDEEDEQESREATTSRHAAHVDTSGASLVRLSALPSPGTRGSAPTGLPPIAPVSTHPYDVPSPSRQRSFSPPPPFPGEQVERALLFAPSAQQQENGVWPAARARSPSPERPAPASITAVEHEPSPNPRPVVDEADWRQSAYAFRAARAGRSHSSLTSLSPLSSPSREPVVVGVVEYTPSVTASSAEPSPLHQAPAPAPLANASRPVHARATTDVFCTLSPYRRDAESPEAQRPTAADRARSPSPVAPTLLCRATVEILPGHSVVVDLFEGDDALSCARAFIERHGLREEMALEPLVAFFAQQLQAHAAPTRRPRRETSPTVPQLRYRTAHTAPRTARAAASGTPRSEGNAVAVESASRLAAGRHRHPAVAERSASEPAPPPVVPRPRSRAASPARSPLPTARSAGSSSSARQEAAPTSLPTWNASTRVRSTTPGDALADVSRRGRSASTSSARSWRASVTRTSLTSPTSSFASPSPRVRSRSRDSSQTRLDTSVLAPRPTRASLLRAQATQKAREARTEGPFPQEERTSDSASAASARRQTRTAPGTAALCRRASLGRSQSREDITTLRRTPSTNSVGSAAKSSTAPPVTSVPHYAQNTQSARGRAHGRPTSAGRTRSAETQPFVRVPSGPVPARAVKKRVTFAPTPARAVRPPPSVRAVVQPVKAESRGQRSLFAHVDPNQGMRRTTVKATTRPVSHDSPTAACVSPPAPVVSSEAEKAAVAKKARLWFTALGAVARTAAVPTPSPPRAEDRGTNGAVDRSTGAVSTHATTWPAPLTQAAPRPRSRLLQTLRQDLDTTSHGRSRSRSAEVEAERVAHSVVHSRLWHDLGLDDAARHGGAPEAVRPLFKPYIGR